MTSVYSPSLSLQRNVHEKIKPYVCSFPDCDRQFGNAWNQKKHELQAHNFSTPETSVQLPANAPPTIRRDHGSSSEASGPPLARFHDMYNSGRPHYYPLGDQHSVYHDHRSTGRPIANASHSKLHQDPSRRKR